MFGNWFKVFTLYTSILFCCASLLGAIEVTDSIRQELGMTVAQDITFYGVRETNPLNKDNWQGQNDWEASMEGDLDWYLLMADRLSFSLSGAVRWKEAAGTYWKESPSMREGANLYVREALLSADIPATPFRLMAGKTMVRHGPAVLLPITDFLIKDTKLNNGDNWGKWLFGLSGSFSAVMVELWAFPEHTWFADDYRKRDSGDNEVPMALFHLSFTHSIHRLGFLYYHNGEHSAGMYYSGQIDESLLPYMEGAISSSSLVRSLDGSTLTHRSDGWSADFLAGMSYAPSFADVSVFLEYRYRSSGYSESDWKDLEIALSSLHIDRPYDYYPVCGYLSTTTPYLETAIHAVGLRIQNTGLVAGFLNYSLTSFFLAPDGCYSAARIELHAIDRLSLAVQGVSIVSVDRAGETAWWNNTWNIQIAARWTVRAYE